MVYHSDELVAALAERAAQLRRTAIEMIYCAQSGHPGGSLSAADLLTALLFHKMRLDPANPGWPERDRLILSKGHAAPLLYAALAQRGFFPIEELKTLRQLDSRLQGHPDRLKTPGVDMTAGALGHGLAIGAGLALSARLDNQTFRTYVVLGDGELQAGVIWEGALFAAKYHLDNITVIVDLNGVQLDGPVRDIMPIEPIVDKWRSFGWYVIEIHGHNMRQIIDALDEADDIHGQPTVIIAHTTKGKGVSFMENQCTWHGRAPSPEQCQQAICELAVSPDAADAAGPAGGGQ
jgi:transketolase